MPIEVQLRQLRRGPLGLTSAIGYLIQGDFHRGEPTLAMEDGTTADSAAALMDGTETSASATTC